jgi:hypothetical protein
MLFEQIDPARDAGLLDALLTSAQIDAIEVEGGNVALPRGIDGEMAIAGLSPHETFRLAVLIQPPRQPLHLEGQGEFVHALPASP